MFVEISLIQEFTLFLGHPVYAVSWVILSLLVFAGLGSRVSIFIHTSKEIRWILFLIAGLIVLYALALPKVLPRFQGAPLLARQVFSVFLIAPLGLAMGIPFPSGIRLLGAHRPEVVPWAWCANGCASVLGAILPVIIAMEWGFQIVLIMASLLYALGFCSWGKIKPIPHSNEMP